MNEESKVLIDLMSYRILVRQDKVVDVIEQIVTSKQINSYDKLNFIRCVLGLDEEDTAKEK